MRRRAYDAPTLKSNSELFHKTHQGNCLRRVVICRQQLSAMTRWLASRCVLTQRLTGYRCTVVAQNGRSPLRQQTNSFYSHHSKKRRVSR